MVVGKALVERLDVELGDDLLLTLTRADGEMEYAMLRDRRDRIYWQPHD